MTKIASNLTELIGNTPLLELSNFNKKHQLKAAIIAKLEYFNPAGSVKDRIGLAMIEAAEKQGLLNKDSVIIEPHQRKYRNCPGICRSSQRIPDNHCIT